MNQEERDRLYSKDRAPAARPFDSLRRQADKNDEIAGQIFRSHAQEALEESARLLRDAADMLESPSQAAT